MDKTGSTIDVEPYKNRVISFPASIYPEVGEIIDKFDELHQPIDGLDIRTVLEECPQEKKLFEDCFKFPDKKYYIDLEAAEASKETKFIKNKKIIEAKLLNYLSHILREKPKSNAVLGWSANYTSFQNQAFWKYHVRNHPRFLKNLGVWLMGAHYYPPGAFREWHTNAGSKMKWALYYVRVEKEDQSWFHFLRPDTDDLVQLPDQDKVFNLFYIADLYEYKTKRRPDLFWHNVASKTHRCSLGLGVSEKIVKELLRRITVTSKYG